MIGSFVVNTVVARILQEVAQLLKPLKFTRNFMCSASNFFRAFSSTAIIQRRSNRTSGVSLVVSSWAKRVLASSSSKENNGLPEPRLMA